MTELRYLSLDEVKKPGFYFMRRPNYGTNDHPEYWDVCEFNRFRDGWRVVVIGSECESVLLPSNPGVDYEHFKEFVYVGPLEEPPWP